MMNKRKKERKIVELVRKKGKKKENIEETKKMKEVP